MEKMILVAASELRGGTIDKTSGKKLAAILHAGAELTETKALALGLDDVTIAALIDRGTLEQIPARVAAGDRADEIEDLRQQLADALRRANLAEGVLGAGSGSLMDLTEDEGLTRLEFVTFLDRFGVVVPEGATIEQILAMEPPEGPEFDGISLADMRAALNLAGVIFDEKDTPEDLLELAIEHGVPDDVDMAAKVIERDMKVDDIKAELTEGQVPFETDANKPALARLLAQVRPSLKVIEKA